MQATTVTNSNSLKENYTLSSVKMQAQVYNQSQGAVKGHFTVTKSVVISRIQCVNMSMNKAGTA